METERMIPLDGLKFGWRSNVPGFTSCPKCECMVMATRKQEHEKVCPNRFEIDPANNLTGIPAAGLESMRSPLMAYAGMDRDFEQKHKQYQADAIRQADAENLRARNQLQRTDDLGYATRLAESMAVKFYPESSWKPLPDLSGVLTQIDNMLGGLERRNNDWTK